MIQFDIQRIIDDKDHPGLRIAGRFTALEKYAGLLTRYLPHVKDQERLRFEAQLRRRFPRVARDQLDEEFFEEIEWVTKELVPQYFIGAFAVALWAEIEQSCADIAKYVRDRESLKLKYSDLRQASAWDKLLIYLEAAWREPLRFEKATEARLDYLHAVRNCIAHANGHVSVDPDPGRRKKIAALAKADLGATITNDQLILSHRFARESMEIVAAAFSDMLRRVDQKYPVRKTVSGLEISAMICKKSK